MLRFILLVCLVPNGYSAPTPQRQLSSEEYKNQRMLLSRPSPINPDIPSDPKPEEKITKITDEKEIAKHKRETSDNNPYDHISRFAPTVAPENKEEKEQSSKSHEQYSVDTVSIQHRHKREEDGYILDTKKTTASLQQRRQVDPHLIGASTVGVIPLINNSDEEKTLRDEEMAHENLTEKSPLSEDQQYDVQAISAIKQHVDIAKRDIPVPLVPKYHHPEESPKSTEITEKHQRQAAMHDKHDKSSESDESYESSKDKMSLTPAQSHQTAQLGTYSPTANIYNAQLSAQSLPNVKQSKPGSYKSNPLNQQAIQTVVHKEDTTDSSPQTPIQVSQATEAISEEVHGTTLAEHGNKLLADQLATIKPTQIIAYEASANDDHLAIKHPVPVADLFSRPK